MLKQILIASLVVTSVAASAHAQEAQSVKVSVAGIDTRSEGGARIELKRIQAAAASICGPAPSNLMDRHVSYEPCVRDVTQRTVEGLKNPLLTELFTTGRVGFHPAQVASAK